MSTRRSVSFSRLRQMLQAHGLRLLAVLLIPVFTAAGIAQVGNGRIRGTVTDPQQRVISAAAVVLTNEQTGSISRTKTTSSGEFTFPQVQLGMYSLRVDETAFQSFQQNGIRVTADGNLTLPVKLSLGSSSETVTVTGAGTLVDTQTGTIQSTIESKSIEDLPLAGRDPRQLIGLAQGVAATAPTFNSAAQSSTLPGTPFFSVNGGRANTLNYLLDGIDNNDSYTNVSAPYPDPDALAQFSIQVSNFDAEYGRSSGAIVNAITKSGTNKVHGSVYEFQQNSTFGLNALSAIDRYNGATVPILHFNQFGGSIGGPVVLPHLYDGHDRSFFFGSYQQTISHSASSRAQVIVPNAAQRGGDLSGAGVTVLDPLSPLDPATGKPTVAFAGNQIPTKRLDPAAQQFLNAYVPLPNSTDPTQPNAFFYRQPSTSSQGQLTIRGDQNLPHGNQLALSYYRYTYDGGALSPLPGNIYYARAGFTGVEHHAAINLTSVLSPHVVNLLSIGYSHLHTHPGNPPAGYPTSDTLGLKVYSAPPNPLTFGIAGFAGSPGEGGNGLPNNRNNYPLTDAVSLQRGAHSIKFGGGVAGQQQHWVYNQAFPNFYFSGDYSGYGLADFLLGYPRYLVEGNTQILDTRFKQWFLFAQDNWKATSRLTLDLGLRWEPFFPPHFVGGFNPISQIRPGAVASGQHSTVFPNAPAGLFFAGDPGVPKGGTDPVLSSVSPRLGFAYDVTGKQSTVLRGAFGLFFDQPKSINYNRFTNGQPFNIFEQLYNDAGKLYNWRDPYQGGVDPVAVFAKQANNPGRDAQFFAPLQGELQFINFHVPYVAQWNLTVEQQLPMRNLLRITYVGSKATHLQWARDSNAPQRQAGPSAQWASEQARRPLNPSFSYIHGLFWDGYSEYQSIQVSLERRFRQGLSVNLNYNHSRNFDSNSDGAEYINIGVQNPYDVSSEYGPSDLDIPNNFTGSFVWELPIPSTGNRFADLFVRGYQLNSIFSVHSAPPFSVYSVYDNELTTQPYQRAKLVGNPSLATRGAKLPYSAYFNTAAFNDTYTPDNDSNISGRNAFRGPGYANIDLSAFKNLDFERAQVQLRLQAFNAFNNASLGINGATQYHFSNDFGKLTTSKGGRVLQFGVHMTF